MSHPLDDLYSRLLNNWQRDPSTLDNPLLARAFEAGEVNRNLEGKLEQAERGLGAERERYHSLKAHAEQERARLTRELANATAKIDRLQHTLTLELNEALKTIAALERDLLPPQPVKMQQNEAEQLAGLGWRKGT